MGGHAFGWIEIIASFGTILGVLGWQWVSIRRTLRRDRQEAERAKRDGS